MNSHSLYFLARLYTISEGFSTLLPTPVMLPPSTLNWPSGELPELWSDEKPKALPDCWPLLPPPTPPLRPKPEELPPPKPFWPPGELPPKLPPAFPPGFPVALLSPESS